jgi:hypothetical protein
MGTISPRKSPERLSVDIEGFPEKVPGSTTLVRAHSLGGVKVSEVLMQEVH